MAKSKRNWGKTNWRRKKSIESKAVMVQPLGNMLAMKIWEVQFGLSTIIDQETIHCVVIGAHRNLAIWKRPMSEFWQTMCRKKWSPCLKTSHQLSYYRDARNFGQSSNRSYHQVPLPKRGICWLEMPRYCSLLCNYAVKGWKRQQSCSVSLHGYSLRKSSPAVCQYDWQKRVKGLQVTQKQKKAPKNQEVAS